MPASLVFRDILSEDLPAFLDLMGSDGASSGCWCMRWRLAPADFEAGRGDSNCTSMTGLIRSNRTPGLLAFDRDVAVGWVSVGPWNDFVGMAADPGTFPMPPPDAWVINCLFVRPGYRKQGISAMLINEASAKAFDEGAPLVVGFPRDPSTVDHRADETYGGSLSAFLSAGFLADKGRAGSRVRVSRQNDL